MYEAGLLIFAISGIASCYLGWDAYKHRFLPIARPLLIISVHLTLTCLVRFLDLLHADLPRWVEQAFTDFDFFILNTLMIPLWIWLLLEYSQDKIVRPYNKIILLFLIQPGIVMTLALTDMLTSGFLSQVSQTALIDPSDRLGDYLIVRHIYGSVVIGAILLVTPYLIRKHQQAPLINLIPVVLTLLIPIAFTFLYWGGVLSLSLGAPPMIFYVLWGSRQFRLLDVMPVALQGVMDKIDAGIIVGNVHSKLLYVNDYAQKIFTLKVTESALQARELSMPDLFEQYFDFNLAEKQTALMQTSHHERHHETRYIAAVLQPIFNPKVGRHLGSMVSFHDITERRQAELELESYNRQKSEFFAGISHEFRTPLTLSLGNIDDVLNDLDKAKPKALEAPLLQAKASNKRLLSLVNQLLELSRVDKGALTIKPVKLELSTYLPMLIANFESMAEKQNIQLHFSIANKARQDSTVYFDTDALDKVVINLISNALKSITGNQGGRVDILLDHSDDAALALTIRDTGCGIPADAVPKIFEMFYSHQMDNPVWPQGTGVGLSLVKQLLVLHSADITVESVEGEGTCFTLILQRGYTHFPEGVDTSQQFETPEYTQSAISLELIDAEEILDDDQLEGNPPPASESSSSHKQTMSKQVLLAEDNPDMRRYIRKHLADFSLIEAADGEEALALAQQSMPDLILSDVMMPKMNGYDLCKQLKSDPQTSHIPLVLLTSKSDQSEKLEGLSLGADDYLSKPFDVKELKLRINNLIASRDSIKSFYQVNGLEKVISHPELPKRETVFLEKLQTYVRDNIENSDIKISDLAETVFMSERSLSRKVKTLTGDTPKKMLLTIRLEHAAKRLADSDDNITSLCYEVGFSDASHFARTFKSHYAMTPTEYREHHLSA